MPGNSNDYDRRRVQRGFTLVEVLAAFVILALSLGALYQVFSTGLDLTARSEKLSRATLIAQSVMDRVDVEGPLSPGRYEGTDSDGMAWTVEITPFTEATGEAASKTRLVRVDVSLDLGGVPVTLSSLRIASANP